MSQFLVTDRKLVLTCKEKLWILKHLNLKNGLYKWEEFFLYNSNTLKLYSWNAFICKSANRIPATINEKIISDYHKI